MGDKKGSVQPQCQVAPSTLFLPPSLPRRIGKERQPIAHANGPYQKSPEIAQLYDKVTFDSPWLALHPMEVILGLVSQNERESRESQWELG